MALHEKRWGELSGFFSTIAYCLSLSWKASKIYTVIRIASEIFMPLLLIVASFIGKYLIDMLAGAGAAENTGEMLLVLFACLLAITLLRTVCQKTTQYCQSTHNEIISGKLALSMMERSLAADLEYMDNPDYHDKLLSATRDSAAVTNLLWNALACISSSVSLLGAFVVLCQSNVLYGFMMMAAAFPSSIAAAKHTKSLYYLSMEQINGERQKSYYQSLAVDKSHAQDVRLFNAGDRLKERYTRLWQELFDKRRTLMRKRTLLTCLMDCLPEIVVVIISIHIAFQVIGKMATVGDYSLYTGLISQLWAAISRLSSSVMQIYDNQMKIANVKSLEHFRNRITDNGTKPLDYVGSIEFDHVCFTYPGARVRAVDDISFMLRKEEKVALVGLNGSGKSTLIKLLLRLYEPDCGSIKINGTDIKEYSLIELRANFSVYFQEMQNYFFTLRDNFTISDSKCQNVDELIMSALRDSCCEDVLKKAGKGLDTNLTRFFEADGIELSGGQHQKLALARVFFRRHTALILDEPSSNLDPKAEHNIFRSLQTLTQGKMTLFTSHRLSNIFLADRIIVLEKGKIVEDGTQEELLENRQRYAELFRYQQEKYLVVEEQKKKSC